MRTYINVPCSTCGTTLDVPVEPNTKWTQRVSDQVVIYFWPQHVKHVCKPLADTPQLLPETP